MQTPSALDGNDLEIAPLAVCPQFAELHFWVLSCKSADTGIKGDADHGLG
jgi:hypothetical protein